MHSMVNPRGGFVGIAILDRFQTEYRDYVFIYRDNSGMLGCNTDHSIWGVVEQRLCCELSGSLR